VTRAEIDALADEGAVFTREVDRADPRFEVVSIRRLTAATYGGPVLEDARHVGLRGRAMFMAFVLATTVGLARGAGGDDLLAKRIEKLAMRLGVR
jgi:hypothetical protein